MPADTDRNLLFGLLALQNGMITRDQLVAAFGAWTGTPGRSIADYLVAQRALTPARRALLDALATEHIAAHGGDPQASLASLEVGSSTCDTLARVAGAGVESSLARVGTARRGDAGEPGGGDAAGAEVRWRCVCEAFASVVRKDPEERAAHLEHACGGDIALRAEVIRLLAADALVNNERFMDIPDMRTSFPAGGDAEMSTTLFPADIAANADHRYRLIRPHARGGLGAVFVAVDTELNREVAIKQILDRHADDPSCRQRFLIEAEITGGLEHPGIVPVYSLGVYDDGRPYYAMRFIKGESLREAIARFHTVDAYKADPGRRSLELRKLLRRFTDVCNAIEYAHSRGVLHRDIKPGKVIVGWYGETLVVDWGLAKPLGRAAADAAAGERTLTPSSGSGSAETVPGMAIGTPGYMSPEQAAGDLDRLGPRSDVYSLGATLYSLLTGRSPFSGEVEEVLRKVKHGEFTPPRQLDPAIDRALEAVCLKAMATKPEDRYPSCRALAEDAERWAADEPVTSYREPLARRARRWGKRHRTAVTGAAATLLAGIIGVAAVAVVQTKANADLRVANVKVNEDLIETGKAKKATETALAESKESLSQAKAVSKFLVDSFRSPDPSLDGKTMLVVDVLDRATDALEKDFTGTSATRAALLDALGQTYFGLGLHAKAEAALSKASDLRLTTLGPDHPETLESRNALAVVYDETGRPAEAIRIHREVLRLRETRLGPVHRDTLESRNNLANSYYQTGRRDEALQMQEETLKLYELTFGPDDDNTLLSRNNLALIYSLAGQTAKAIQMHEETLKRYQSKRARDHPDTLRSRNNLAIAYYSAGRMDDAIRLGEVTVRLSEARLGADHLDTLTNRNNLAEFYRRGNRTTEAIQLLERTSKLLESKYGRDHPNTLSSRNNLANSYMAAGQTNEAIKIHEETVKIREAKLDPDHPDLLISRWSLAVACLAAGQTSRAISLLEGTLKGMTSKLGPEHSHTRGVSTRLADTFESLDRWADAEPLRRTMLASRRKTETPESLVLAGDLAALGLNLLNQSKWLEAERVVRECLTIREKAGPDDWSRFHAMSLLGATLLSQGRYAEAEPLVVTGYEGMKAREAKIPALSKPALARAAERVVGLYEAWGKPKQAKAWKEKLHLDDLPADVFAE